MLDHPFFSIGCDLVEVDRIGEIVNRRSGFLHRHFLESERAYFAKHRSPYPHIAGHFAAKEALAKALGWGMKTPLDFCTIVISHNELGQPQANLLHQALEKWNEIKFQVTISHTRCHALAVVLAICHDKKSVD